MAKEIEMPILKMIPAYKDYLWGGNKLKEKFGKEFEGETLAESWELSCHTDGPSVIANGSDKGKTLPDYLLEHGKKVLGKNCDKFDEFPILIKFIDARDNLSIQVHPNNEYALENEGQYGKTEAWYVVSAGEESGIYYGVKEEVSKEQFEKSIKEDTILDILNFKKVKAGEVYFIEAGTIHSIGKDVLVAEIQQNSNITYRVYDFKREDSDGKRRELNIEKAKEVTNLKPIADQYEFGTHLADCEYFTIDLIDRAESYHGLTDGSTFHSIVILEGKGEISTQNEVMEFRAGESFFITAQTGSYVIRGQVKALLTTIRP